MRTSYNIFLKGLPFFPDHAKCACGIIDIYEIIILYTRSKFRRNPLKTIFYRHIDQSRTHLSRSINIGNNSPYKIDPQLFRFYKPHNMRSQLTAPIYISNPCDFRLVSNFICFIFHNTTCAYKSATSQCRGRLYRFHGSQNIAHLQSVVATLWPGTSCPCKMIKQIVILPG